MKQKYCFWVLTPFFNEKNPKFLLQMIWATHVLKGDNWPNWIKQIQKKNLTNAYVEELYLTSGLREISG